MAAAPWFPADAGIQSTTKHASKTLRCCAQPSPLMSKGELKGV